MKADIEALKRIAEAALRCLYLEAPESVVKDVSAKVEAVFAAQAARIEALEAELASLRSEREGMREGNSSVSPLASPSVVSPSGGQQLRTGKTSSMLDFAPFPKMPRLAREVIVSEKIDGTNAQVFIRRLPDNEEMPTDTPIVAVVGDLLIYAGSRSRWITPADDNFGFAAWVRDHADELAGLGEGQHFGEWWGAGIQRRYGLTEKRFSLFNVSRWADERPACCHVVPVLYRGVFDTARIEATLTLLGATGSVAAPGFMKPEGVIVYHVAGRCGFKRTIEKDDEPKSLGRVAA